MTNDFFELNRVIGELSRARNVFESQAAYEHLKKALATETTEVELQEVLSSLRDMVHASVLSDALIDYNNQPELYPERASTMINLLPKFQ